MYNFELENGCINLIYYTSIKYLCTVVTDQEGKKKFNISIRLRLTDGEYYYVRGINACLSLLIELEIDSYNFISKFYQIIDSTDVIELTSDELKLMEERDATRS